MLRCALGSRGLTARGHRLGWATLASRPCAPTASAAAPAATAFAATLARTSAATFPRATPSAFACGFGVGSFCSGPGSRLRLRSGAGCAVRLGGPPGGVMITVTPLRPVAAIAAPAFRAAAFAVWASAIATAWGPSMIAPHFLRPLALTMSAPVGGGFRGRGRGSGLGLGGEQPLQARPEPLRRASLADARFGHGGGRNRMHQDGCRGRRQDGGDGGSLGGRALVARAAGLCHLGRHGHQVAGLTVLG